MNQTVSDSSSDKLQFPAQQHICVVGMGYVGLPLALAFQQHGPVTGFDINSQRITELQQGVDVTLEASSAELQAAQQLCYTDNAADLADCNVYIVTVPTPIDLSQQPDLGAIKSATELIAGYLQKGDMAIW